MIGIHSMCNALVRQLIKNGRRTGDAAGVVDVLLLDVVEPRQESGTYATFEQGPHAQDASSEFFDDFAGYAVIQHHVRQELHGPQPTEWRALRVVVKEVPVT